MVILSIGFCPRDIIQENCSFLYIVPQKLENSFHGSLISVLFARVNPWFQQSFFTRCELESCYYPGDTPQPVEMWCLIKQNPGRFWSMQRAVGLFPSLFWTLPDSLSWPQLVLDSCAIPSTSRGYCHLKSLDPSHISDDSLVLFHLCGAAEFSLSTILSLIVGKFILLVLAPFFLNLDLQ